MELAGLNEAFESLIVRALPLSEEINNDPG
jgi:hypothetical protein